MYGMGAKSYGISSSYETSSSYENLNFKGIDISYVDTPTLI